MSNLSAETLERMDGLVDTEYKDSMLMSMENLFIDLIQEGFEDQDIMSYVRHNAETILTAVHEVLKHHNNATVIQKCSSCGYAHK